jgi:hypothetical protein
MNKTLFAFAFTLLASPAFAASGTYWCSLEYQTGPGQQSMVDYVPAPTGSIVTNVLPGMPGKIYVIQAGALESGDLQFDFEVGPGQANPDGSISIDSEASYSAIVPAGTDHFLGNSGSHSALVLAIACELR